MMIYVLWLTVVNCREINPELCEMTVILVKLTVVGKVIYFFKAVFSYQILYDINVILTNQIQAWCATANRKSIISIETHLNLLEVNYKGIINDIIPSMTIHW